MGEKTRLANLEKEVERLKEENDNLKRELFTVMTEKMFSDEEAVQKMQDTVKQHELEMAMLKKKYEATIEMMKRVRPPVL